MEEALMKKWIASTSILTALFFALTLPTAVPSALATPAPAPEPHPEIRAAIGSINRARTHLQEAAHDFGGHRVDAIKALDEAQRQLNICLQYDK
jgi:hypothetical protein